MSLSLSFHNYKKIKPESYILFKLNKLMVVIEKKPAPGDHESSLKNFICYLCLARCPSAWLSCKGACYSTLISLLLILFPGVIECLKV